jgi:hypothetical protein
MPADISIEVTTQGIRENQRVIDFLRHLFVNEGAMIFPEGRAECVGFFVVTYSLKRAGLDIRHGKRT